MLDPLTGLPTRSILAAAASAFSKADPSEEWAAVVLDVDHFKLVNDIHGHLTGDAVLRETATLLMSSCGDDDFCLRFGGDEFMILFRGRDEEKTSAAVQELIEGMSSLALPSGLRVSLSAGIAMRRPADVVVEQLMERADRALYSAKEAGRGRLAVAREESAGNRQELVFSHLIGRRQELKKLRQLLDESAENGSRAAVVSGEAGVGKSRLAEEMERYCRLRGSMILRGRCAEFFETAPYSLLVTPLRRELAALDAGAAEALSAGVQPLHPATLELLPELSSMTRDDIQYFREERLRFRILEDLSRILAALSARGHMAVILEDLQWITKADLELLCFVVRNTSDCPLFFVLTLRSAAGDSAEVLQGLLSLRNSLPLLHLPLKNLGEADTRNFVLFALHDPNVPSEMQDLLYRQSGGNPLFLKEFLLSLEQSGCILAQEGGGRSYRLPPEVLVPDSLAAVLETKLSRFEQTDLETLRIASLTSGDFGADLLGHASGRGEYETAVFIDRALRAGVLAEAHGGSGQTTYSFAHDAYRSYLSAGVPDILRKALHRRMGAYFEGLCRAGAMENATAAAFHFVAGKDGARALEFAEAAAGQAFRGRANREAVRWYETLLSLAGEDGLPPERQLQALKHLGELYSITGEIEKADGTLRAALEASSGEGMAEILVLMAENSRRTSRYADARASLERVLELTDDVFLRVDVMVSLSFLDYIRGDYETGLAVLADAESKLEGAPGDDPRHDLVRAKLCMRKGDLTTVVRPGYGCLDFYEEAIALYRRHGDRMGEATVLNNMSDVFVHMGDYEKALAMLLDVLEIDERFDNALGMAIVCFNIADAYGRMNNTAQARQYLDRYLEISARILNELGVGYGRMGLGMIAVQEGDFAAAEGEFAKASCVFSGLGSRGLEAEASMRRAEALVRLGRTDEAESILDGIDQASLGARERTFLAYAHGLVELEGDRPQKASAFLRASLQEPGGTPERELAARYSALSEALSRMGDPQGADSALEEGRRELGRRLEAMPSSAVRRAIASMPAVSSLLEAVEIDADARLESG